MSFHRIPNITIIDQVTPTCLSEKSQVVPEVSNFLWFPMGSRVEAFWLPQEAQLLALRHHVWLLLAKQHQTEGALDFQRGMKLYFSIPNPSDFFGTPKMPRN